MVHRSPWAWILLAVSISAACGRASRAHEPVEPIAIAALTPDVKTLVEEHLAAARRDLFDAHARARLGLVYEANQMWPEAEASFAQAAELEPAQPLWRLHRAIALRGIGDLSRSLELLEVVALELPECPATHQRLGEALLASGDAARASDHFGQTIRIVPDRPEGYAGRGACRLALQDHAASVQDLERAVELDPSYRIAHYQLGLAYRAQGRAEDAARELALGLEGEVRFLPDDLTAELFEFTTYLQRMQVAGAWKEAGSATRGVEILEELLEKHPRDVNVLNNLAKQLVDTGDTDRAFDLLQKAKRIDPELPTTWINLSDCLIAMGKLDRALGHAEQAVALAPELSRSHLARARALLGLDRADESKTELETSVELDPRNVDALRLLGETCLVLDLPDEAQKHLTVLARVRPDDPLVRVALCEAALRSGDRSSAESALAEARRIAPDDPRVIELARQLEVR